MRKLAITGMKMMVKIQQDHRKLDAKVIKLADLRLRTDRKMAELAESQKRTDEKFQRWLDARNGSNGHGKKPK